MNTSLDPPIYAWILTLNRLPTIEEYNICFQCLDKDSQTKVTNILARSGDQYAAWSCLCGRLLPHIVMNQREIPISAWRIVGNEDGSKPSILCPAYEKKLGYNISHDGLLVAMAFALGPAAAVANVGCDVRRIHLPSSISTSVFVESLSHKITPLERSFLSTDLGDEVIMRRIFILWTLKEAYLKAIGQPLRLGFDWNRIECDIPNETITVDGRILCGWEFRLFKANVNVHPRKDPRSEQVYQVTAAIYRGGESTSFVWNQELKLDPWLRFLTVDSVMDAVWDLQYPHITSFLKLKLDQQR
ncbi:uncharacterized protein EI90DRAFT_3055653 [Cantharellus anzutake]|uniref:uncharacterized protein n=1 Tax=Cantharellus anzutake TaxID=1750568 RepID=UPI001905909E|nr:uncharacterized protein EI90DRAFT_3055653 [Cantharellus anzutake]KAF8331858.1 hypothetical protein EI90DRAFT_3055653 [Cantharellus anzutake]